MPRDIPVGNGSLLINFDSSYRIADVYYPHAGMENHAGSRFRFGLFEEGSFGWIDASEWSKSLRYVRDTLVTQVVLESESRGLRLHCFDAVDYEANVYVRKVVVRNLRSTPREVKLFFHHSFHLYGNAIGDTVLFDPESRTIMHYKAKRYFLIDTAIGEDFGVAEYACGRSGMNGAEGTWRDAEDGQLSMNAVAQGAVDSTVAIRVPLAASGTETVFHWMCAGERYGEVRDLDAAVRKEGPARLIGRTASFWAAWVNKQNDDFADLPDDIVELYKQSLLIVRTQCDRDGAILAANDSDIQYGHSDHYSYMWPRDGALVGDAMDRAGFHELTRSFLLFAHRVIKKEGYFLHKYNPDGSVASSWHPWIRDGQLQLPIQEDETALVLWLLQRYYERTRDLEFVRSVYHRLVVQPADFMCDFRDPESGLPLPSYDLWEERQGVFTFTCAAVYAGLSAAAELANLFNEQQRRHRYLKALSEIRDAMMKHLWMPAEARFARGLILSDVGLVLDPTIDASVFGTFFFGVFHPTSTMVESTMAAVREHLWVNTKVGGVARYVNDSYQRISSDIERVPGNPWFICTLWLAEHMVAKASSIEELHTAITLLRWASEKALPSHVIAEQIHPYSGMPLSVAPLTWSHAQVISVVRNYLDRMTILRVPMNGKWLETGTKNTRGTDD